MQDFQSWGRVPRAEHKVQHVDWRCGNCMPVTDLTVLPYGLGRSYGDCCLNNGGMILAMERLNRFISFDAEKGVLRCEAGVTLEDILNFALPRGWFLPVSPGTKFVTVGGAIANDVHGKNHHRAGTFGAHVERLALLRSDGRVLECSREQESGLFGATIAGIGLTGLILWADIRLKKVKNGFFDVELIQFSGLEEFSEISNASDREFEYTVAWLDCVAGGDNFARGIFMRGNHCQKEAAELPKLKKGLSVPVPCDAPGFLLNNWSIRLFNTVYYHKQSAKSVRKLMPYEPFFYPLDAVLNWNRIYGRSGMFQFQCVLPKQSDNQAIKVVLESIVQSGRASFLAVLKEFGGIGSPGMMSFPREGVTLCLDFANRGAATVELLRDLESLVCKHGGRMYPAKDAVMMPESFEQFYPQWREFADFIDPKFSSSFWRRVTWELK